MKEHKIEKTKVEITYEYEAIDGNIFKDKNECLKYEESAKMVAYSKYQPLVISRKSEYEIYGAGSEEYEIDIIKINKDEDIDILIQLYCLYNNWKENKDILETRNLLNKWYSTGETIFIGRGSNYDNYDCFWFISTMNETIQHIMKACYEEEA